MNYLIEPEKGQWLAVKESINKSSLRHKILSSEVCISDFDGTDVYSPIGMVAVYFNPSHLASPRYLGWAIKSFATWLVRSKSVDNAWQYYQNHFLDKKERIRVAQRLGHRMMNWLLYPGVKELYATMPMHKAYVTRNVHEIVTKFANYVGVNEVIAGVTNKKKTVEELIKTRAFRHFLYKADDKPEEEEVLDMLRHYQKRGNICPISLMRSDSPKDTSKFDVVTGKNYHCLVDVLRGLSY
jgi:hypothetical protein